MVTVIFSFLLGLGIVYIGLKREWAEKENKALKTQVDGLDQELINTKNKLKQTLSQKKSSEVRTGLIVEQMSPFLEGFPYDPKSSNFLAKPIDFVVFDDDGVHFVEVKSGNAKLSSSQRRVRDQILEGKVTFEVYRIKGDA